jgi:hypothetical protein
MGTAGRVLLAAPIPEWWPWTDEGRWPWRDGDSEARSFPVMLTVTRPGCLSWARCCEALSLATLPALPGGGGAHAIPPFQTWKLRL